MSCADTMSTISPPFVGCKSAQLPVDIIALFMTHDNGFDETAQ